MIRWRRSHFTYQKVQIHRFSYTETHCRPTREIICPYTENPPQAVFSSILSPNSRTSLFGAKGKIVRTGHHHRPKTLLAGVDTALADLVVLAAAVLTQEESPFQPPLLAPAHR